MDNVAALSERECVLTTSDMTDKGKKNECDFVLWKTSILRMWPSSWDLGRPSCNIGCSVMANTVLDSHFDIHTGVIDVEFLACLTERSHLEFTNSWLSYFHHGWHLNFPKCKMSKSSR
ncbi:unnamed protein product [Rotaria sp. Silwood1]|nr:unnamed protein product [Rotaria sp. Silwood1]